MPRLPLWMRFICWHIPLSLFLWVSQIHLTGRKLKFFENRYLHKGESSAFLLPPRVGSTVWARRWWVALTRGPTCTWPEVHCLSLPGWCGGSGIGCGERRGPGGCKASWEFTAALTSLCHHRKRWGTHILMSISRGHCRLETKQALALQFGEEPGVRCGWGSQNHQSDGKKRRFRTVTHQILQLILWVMDLIKEKTSLLWPSGSSSENVGLVVPMGSKKNGMVPSLHLSCPWTKGAQRCLSTSLIPDWLELVGKGAGAQKSHVDTARCHRGRSRGQGWASS